LRDLRNVGGTRGGLRHFLIGLLLFGVGLYLLMDRVTVYGGFWSFSGSSQSSFGILLIPMMIGLSTLFFNGGSWLGWILFVGSLLAIVTGLIANLQIHFQSTSLVATLVILGLVSAGIGLIVRSLSAVGSEA
jgi:hypothetical protein